jgi:polysaccharide export outer membrane protein
MRALFLLSALALTCSACAGSTALGGGPEGVLVKDASSLPPPDGPDTVGKSRPYLVGPFDKLSIDVFGMPELAAREVQVDANGNIAFPIVGSIPASGKTPLQIAGLIEQELRQKFVRNPQVSVNLTDTVSQVVTIDGEVRDPGLYPVIGDMTLMQAIARAKGVGEFARLNDVVIFRTVKGQRMAALYNLGAIRRGVYSDPDVYPNDVIVVGNSSARRIFRDVLQAAPLITTPMILLFQNR